MRGNSAVPGWRLLVLLLLPALGACEWFTDFKRQPSIQTWQVVIDSTHPSRVNPEFSVPITGMTVPGFAVSYRPLPTVVDSMSGLANPVAADPRSLERGHRYYQINCAVCHGDRGTGDGPAGQYGMPGISIVGDAARARTDGYIWGVIRNGRGLMPSYNRIEEMSRWDVVNYVRALQAGEPLQVATGPIAAPGVTGEAIPGATRMAPTVPPPFHGTPALEVPAPALDTTPFVPLDTIPLQAPEPSPPGEVAP